MFLEKNVKTFFPIVQRKEEEKRKSYIKSISPKREFRMNPQAIELSENIDSFHIIIISSFRVYIKYIYIYIYKTTHIKELSIY